VSEEENIAKKNKVRTKKKSENIINIGEDEDDDEDDVMEPRKKEGEMLFAQEALKESSLEKPQEHEYSTSVTDFLGSKYIHLLKKKSVKFPRARWFCRLCEYHCDNLTKCGEHFRDNRHSRLSRVRQVETTLYHLPRPNKHHLDSLNSLLLQVEKEHGLSQADLEMRKSVADNLHGLLNRHIPGCTVRLYGSSLSGFGLKTSNVNLDLQIVADSKPHLALLKTLEVLQSASDYIEVVDDFTAKIPHINFKTGTGLDCELSLNNCNAFQTSGLLADYWQLDSRVRVLGVCFRHWAHTTHLDRQAEGTLPPHTFAILLIYFLQQQTKPVLPCIHDLIPPAEASEETYVAPREALAAWRTQSQASPAELWIELFGFYSIGYKMQELVVSIRKSGALTREDKQWKTKRLAVEDPFSPKRNLSRSIQATSVYDFISDCLKTGYLYFGTIQTSLGPIITRINIPDSNSAPSSPTPEEDPAIPTGLTLESWLGSHGTSLTEKEALAASSLVPRNMIVFSFLQKLLTNGHLPAIQCCVCSAEGHMGSNCPEEQLPPLTNLPSLTPLYLQLLDSVCDAISKDWEPQEPELRDRDFIVSDLNRYIQKIFPTAQLSLFGSSSNGFAFRQSDLDISLTFTDHKTSDELDCIQIIETLCEKIKRMVGMRNVTAITSAKVPIVKLYHQKLQIDADISLYNVLARENTRMLCLYSDVDIRVKQLGYMVKFFAKVCDIGDASRGSLSSYAYILMMIFYLQQCSPPVIPVLQEMYKGEEKEKPENMVDGWNAWFMSDRRRVVNEWPGYRQNKQTVGQLWIGFLDFYARQFDDRRLVVAIKQQKPLSKFEKMWNSPCIAIEDPFELNHNLGAGISRKMNLYIKKAFINARRLFGTPFKVNPPGYKYIQDYFFDPQLLTDGAPPNDRGCRACGKIGHLVADCPRKKASDQRRKREREERQRSNTEDPRNRDQRDHQDGGGRNRSQSEIVGVGQIKAKIEDAKNKGRPEDGEKWPRKIPENIQARNPLEQTRNPLEQSRNPMVEQARNPMEQARNPLVSPSDQVSSPRDDFTRMPPPPQLPQALPQMSLEDQQKFPGSTGAVLARLLSGLPPQMGPPPPVQSNPPPNHPSQQQLPNFLSEMMGLPPSSLPPPPTPPKGFLPFSPIGPPPPLLHGSHPGPRLMGPPHHPPGMQPIMLSQLEEGVDDNRNSKPGGVDLTALAAMAGVTSSQVAPPPSAMTLEDLERSFQSEESSAEEKRPLSPEPQFPRSRTNSGFSLVKGPRPPPGFSQTPPAQEPLGMRPPPSQDPLGIQGLANIATTNDPGMLGLNMPNMFGTPPAFGSSGGIPPFGTSPGRFDGLGPMMMPMLPFPIVRVPFSREGPRPTDSPMNPWQQVPMSVGQALGFGFGQSPPNWPIMAGQSPPVSGFGGPIGPGQGMPGLPMGLGQGMPGMGPRMGGMGPGHGMPMGPGIRPDMPMNHGQGLPMDHRLPMGHEQIGMGPDILGPPPLSDPGIISAGRPRAMPVGEDNLLPPGLVKQLAEGAKMQQQQQMMMSSNEGSLNDLHKENKSDSPRVPFLGQKRDDLGPFMGPDLGALGHLPSDLGTLGHLPMGWPQAPASTGNMFGPITPSSNQGAGAPGPNKENMEQIASFLPTFGNLPNPLQMNQSGFPTSVLFPSDLQHPLREESLAAADRSDPLPSHPNPDTGDMPEGSPQTPPNLNMHRPFHFSLDSEE